MPSLFDFNSIGFKISGRIKRYTIYSPFLILNPLRSLGHQKGNAIGSERSKWNQKTLLFQLLFFLLFMEVLKKGDAQDKKSIWVC